LALRCPREDIVMERALVARRMEGPQNARKYNATRALLGTEYLIETTIAKNRIDSSMSP
jgi:hypothetical protein